MEDHQRFTCPMHPEIMKDAPGTCPICGMNLVPGKAHTHSETHTNHTSPQVSEHHTAHDGHSNHDAQYRS
jgi:Cu2+-exporting ATPase